MAAGVPTRSSQPCLLIWCVTSTLTADLEWNNGKITHYRIATANPCEVKVRVNGEVKSVIAEAALP